MSSAISLKVNVKFCVISWSFLKDSGAIYDFGFIGDFLPSMFLDASGGR